MKKNKRVVIIISIVILTIISIITVLKKDTNIVEKNKVSKIERKEFNIYLQKTVGGEDYDPSADTAFPTSGYLLNTTKTVCKGYNDQEIKPVPLVQELTNDVINGSITINSKNTIYCDLYFDKNETPTINTFNVTGKTSGGTTLNNSFTYQTDKLPFTVTYADNESDVKQYCINETNSIENCNWQTLSETSGTYTLIDASDGEKTMYIYLKDKANNVSVKTDKSTAKITVDQTKPKITSFTLTGKPDEGQELSSSTDYTHKAGITYDAKITETNISEYCVYEDSCSYQPTSSTTLNTNYTLTNTEGSHSVTIKVKDKAGNESDVSTKSITLDKTNPVATISSSSKDTSSITVIVGYSGTDSIIVRQCRVSGGSWQDANTNGSCTISNLSDGTEYTIEGRVRDASGRWSTTYPDIKITTDNKGYPVGNLLKNPPKGLTGTDCNGMKRFEGSCNAASGGCDEIVKNFVCFGYTNKSDCGKGLSGNDYIYRIIGIESDGTMKLIKNKVLNKKYYWDETYPRPTSLRWDRSSLYKALNGDGFLASLSSKWQEKIVSHSWPVSGSKVVSYGYSAEEVCYSHWELDSAQAKIGLMLLDDYYGSTCDSHGSCEGFGGDYRTASGSWLRLLMNGTATDFDEIELTMQVGDDVPANLKVYAVLKGRAVGSSEESNSLIPSYMATYYVRPVFFLSSTTVISSGSGTSTDPFVIDSE